MESRNSRLTGAHWRKSSYSGDQGGDCVECAPLGAAAWRKSSYSSDQGGECVEIAEAPHLVAVRDSKVPDGPPSHPHPGRLHGLRRGRRERRPPRLRLKRQDPGGRAPPGPGLVFQESLPGVSLRNWGRLEPDQDQRAVDHLFSLVLEFLDVRDDSESLARMYTEYHSLQVGR
ncbi:DUF397 domain-containing protein [Streptomyces sp. PmtA]|uniref:DUF397 domain-containing protein n=1 Tax=Streptomyces sp. PmtA TaxID=3074275 RepID=UPI003FCCEA61